MDKAQKQLINTYYRKRKLAAKEDNSYILKNYEIDYGLDNKKIEVNDLSIIQRTNYYNQLWGTEYKFLFRFRKYGEHSNNIALANENNKTFFVNKQGKPDISGVNPDKIDSISEYTVYYNQLWGTDYSEVIEFGEYGENNTLVVDKNDNSFFVNKEGKLDITGINPDKIDNGYNIAIYYNELWGTNYNYVSRFNKYEYGNDVALVYDKNGKTFFLNKQGKPNIGDINSDILDNKFDRTTYNNTKELMAKQNG